MNLAGLEKAFMNNFTAQGAYRCIDCGYLLSPCGNNLSCVKCSLNFEVRSGIPVLTKNERYWCNVPKETMARLNQDAEKGNWKQAVSMHISGNVAGHISDERRIDFRYLLPSLKAKKIIDIGAMWGGIAIPLAKYSGELHAVDATFETLRFLSIRAKQDGIGNLRIALASAHNLPFSDGYFDAALMIGVLEWLGSDHDFIVAKHYGKAMDGVPSKKNNPAALQLKALLQAHRVLKPGGTLLVAIENRFFYKHFFGAPDPHTALPFSSVLPRPLADISMRLFRNQAYTEYTYSYNGYRKLFSEAGFEKLSFHAALPSYRELEVIIPLDENSYAKYYYENFGLKDIRGIRRIIPELIVKLGLMKYFVPSFLITAEKRA